MSILFGIMKMHGQYQPARPVLYVLQGASIRLGLEGKSGRNWGAKLRSAPQFRHFFFLTSGTGHFYHLRRVPGAFFSSLFMPLFSWKKGLEMVITPTPQ
jgi:hypothetical protein